MYIYIYIYIHTNTHAQTETDGRTDGQTDGQTHNTDCAGYVYRGVQSVACRFGLVQCVIDAAVCSRTGTVDGECGTDAKILLKRS